MAGAPEKRTDANAATAAILAPKFTVTCVTRTISGTSAESAQLTAGSYRMVADTDCHIDQGATGGTSTTSSHYLPAGVVEYVDVTGDSDDYITVIQATASGTLFLTRL